jgi:phasin family protein
MADSDNSKAEDSAEKAYAAAAQGIGDKNPVEPTESGEAAEPVEFPAKLKRSGKPEAALETADAGSVEKAVAAEQPAPAEASQKPAAKRAADKAEAGKTASLRKTPLQKTKAAPKTAKPDTAEPNTSTTSRNSLFKQLKEIPMDVTSSINEAVNGAQQKAKEAFTKTSALAGDYGEFAKGNVEAFVESGKILASGLQDLSGKFFADSKAAFETATAEVKELSAANSPADFFKLQTELLRRNLDSAIAYSSKTSEAMLKLTNDVIAPISGRVSLAVEKVRKVA